MRLLQQEIILWGKSIQGDGRGKILGFPTVNLRIHQKMKDGVYCAWTSTRKFKSPALVFIGASQTFGHTKRRMEVHFLIPHQLDPHSWLTIRLLAYIRRSKKFFSSEQLIVAMKNDERIAQKFFRDIYSR